MGDDGITNISVVSSMMPLFAALEVVIAVVVVAAASPGIELCAIRDGNEAGPSLVVLSMIAAETEK